MILAFLWFEKQININNDSLEDYRQFTTQR